MPIKTPSIREITEARIAKAAADSGVSPAIVRTYAIPQRHAWMSGDVIAAAERLAVQCEDDARYTLLCESFRAALEALREFEHEYAGGAGKS